MILCNNFPLANEVVDENETLDPHESYKNCKIRLNTRRFYESILQNDLNSLEEDLKFKKSCGEPELLEFVEQAIFHTRS